MHDRDLDLDLDAAYERFTSSLEAPGDAVARVGARVRVRRRRRASVGVVLAVVVIIAGIGVVGTVVRPPGQFAPPTDPAVTVPKPSAPIPNANGISPPPPGAHPTVTRQAAITTARREVRGYRGVTVTARLKTYSQGIPPSPHVTRVGPFLVWYVVLRNPTTLGTIYRGRGRLTPAQAASPIRCITRVPVRADNGHDVGGEGTYCFTPGSAARTRPALP